MKALERKHVDRVGLDKFDAEVTKALLRLKMDDRLRAAYKLRPELAFQMALRITGFQPFSLATKTNERRFGRATQEMQDICDEYLRSVEPEVVP